MSGDRAAVIRDLHLLNAFQPERPGPGIPNALILATTGLAALGIALAIWVATR